MLGIIPGAINTDSTSKVTFTSFVDDLAIAPVSVFLEEICKDGNVIDEIGLLFDDGNDVDLSPFDSVYSGQFDLVAQSEGERYSPFHLLKVLSTHLLASLSLTLPRCR